MALETNDLIIGGVMPKKEDEVVFDDSLDSVPDFIKKQAEEANKLLNPEPEPDPEQDPEPELETEDPVIEPGPDPVIEQLDPEPEIDPVDVIDEQTFEHKYNTLKGKYDKEIEDLKAENDNQRQMIESLMMHSPAVADPATPAQPEVKPGSLNTEDYEDLEDYMKEVGKRVGLLEKSKETLEGKLKKAEDELAYYKQDSAESAKTTFEGALTDAVPDWRAINSREDWKAFLADPEFAKQMGLYRQNIVENAQRTGNPQPIINLLKEWKKARLPKEPARKLSNEIVPSGDDSNIIVADNVITRAEFERAVALTQKGKMSHEEFQKVNIQYQKAISQGLIEGQPIT